jgi:hypothetical protein
MMLANRVNRFGQSYKLREVFGKPWTHVTFGDKTMVFKVDIRQMCDGWSAWSNGDYIHKAFPFLAPEEREFLMTGILPSELHVKEEESNG